MHRGGSLNMAKRAAKPPGEPTHAEYMAARARAQARANELGFDHGLEWNALFREFSIRMLPSKAYRCGSELQCEVVMPENLDKCQPGHGPCA